MKQILDILMIMMNNNLGYLMGLKIIEKILILLVILIKMSNKIKMKKFLIMLLKNQRMKNKKKCRNKNLDQKG